MTRPGSRQRPDPPAIGGLPLFREAPEPEAKPARLGRVRSTFRFPGDDVDAPSLRVVEPPEPVEAEPREQLEQLEQLPEALELRGPTRSPLTARATPSAPHRAGVDWSLVAAFRGRAAERLTSRLGEAGTREAQQELGRAIITELLDAAAAEAVTEGRKAWSRIEQDGLARAVFDSLFRLGRLQPLVDDDSVENIVVTGHDRVWLERADGSFVPGPPVADSDAELVEFIGFLASRTGEGTARAFAEASPSLDLRLPDGSRLAATNWVTARPSLVIRRHRLVEVTLDDLVRLGTLTPVMASFLAAAVKARLSIVVAGPPGVGKTTMMRALCNEIDPLEQIATFEDPFELFLHEMPERHAVVHAWEARHGTGEIGVDGRPAGEYTTERQLYDSFRYNAQRQIVGEIRGAEVWAMIKAMESGSGSLSTTHASSAAAAMAKLVTCSMEAGRHVSRELAANKLAQAIDLVVQLRADTTGTGGIRRRVVSEIVAVTAGEADRGYALTEVFAQAADRPAVPALLPDHLLGLVDDGFDLDGFRAQARGVGR